MNTAEPKPGFWTRPWGRFLIVFLFALPLLSGVVGKIHKSKSWMGDFEAVACAAEKSLSGQPLYDMALACPGMNPAVYVYIPVVAESAAALVSVLGADGFRGAYIGLYLASLALLAWFSFLRPATIDRPGTRIERVPFLAFVTGSAVTWANVAVVAHAGVALGAMLFRRWPWVLIGLIALGAVIKPVFLTFLAVVLFAAWPLWKRVVAFIAGAALGLAPTLAFMTSNDPRLPVWRETLDYFVYHLTPGESFFGWISLFGLDGRDPVSMGAYLVFAAALTLAGYAIAEGQKLSPESRVLLGLSVGTLLIPRLMSQDFFLLGPGLVVMGLAMRSGSGRIGPRLSKIMLGLCAFALVGGAADLGDYTTKLATLGLALCVLAAGWLSVRQAPEEVWAPIRQALGLKAPQA
ncbi:MAG: hypothetical protein ACK41P_07620 [Asticcacaulis sp.]